MSRVIVAKHAGFCPGVQTATRRLADRLAAKKAGECLYTLGHLIHNEDYNRELERAGVRAVTAAALQISAHSSIELMPYLLRTSRICFSLLL